MSESMAVEAPVLSTSVEDAAHVPHVVAPSVEGQLNGAAGKKRTLSAGEEGRVASEIKKPKTNGAAKAKPVHVKKKTVIESSSEGEDEDDDAPLAAQDGDGDVVMRSVAEQAVVEGVLGEDKDVDMKAADSSDDDKPLAKSAPAAPKPKRKSSASDAPASSKKSKKPTSTASSSATKKPKSKSDEPGPSSKPEGKKAKPAKKSPVKVERQEEESDLSEEDVPLTKSNKAVSSSANGKSKKEKSVKVKSASKRKPAPKKKEESDDESSDMSSEEEEDGDEGYSSDDDKPLAKKAKTVKKPRASNGSAKTTPAGKKGKGKAVKKESGEEESSEDEKPLKKVGKKELVKKEVKVKVEKVKVEKVKKEKVKKEDESEEEGYKWWEQQGEGENDGSVKWTTLAHNGVMFPPEYVPLPKHVKMKYNGVSLTLPPESEEVAGFFAALLETDHAADAKFRENFFKDWKTVLADHPPAEGTKIVDLEKCDFRPMWDYFSAQKEEKKSLTAADKRRIKEEREAIEKPYLHCTIDGRKEKIGNFRAEPPGLFRGRGEHPKKGTHKYRLKPEDITINIGADQPIPIPNIPGNWKKVQHDNTVTWLATWKENVNGQTKYVFLSAGSTWKGQSDRLKFEKARELKKHVDVIRKDYTEDLKSKVMADRQRATAMYLIDRLALRAGNEKGEDEADTVGCCSLRLEHVTLIPPSSIELRFLGKDSIMYEQEVEVVPQVFKNIKIFKQEPKTQTDDLFDRLTTTGLNKHLSSYMKGLSAKVFRTYNASWTFQEQLKGTPVDGTVQEKIAWYNKANKEVAILCNHQKTVSKGHAVSMEKLGDKLLALKYQRMKLRHQLFTMESKAKKRYPEYVDDESDLDEDFFDRHEAATLDLLLEKASKKHEKDNIKAEADGEEKEPEEKLKEKIKEIKEEHKEWVKERKTKKVEPKRATTEDKVVDAIKKMDERIATFKVNLEIRESNKTVALGTSKINYIDPRLTVAWAKKFEVPLERLFSKTLVVKFPWSIAEVEDDPEWEF